MLGAIISNGNKKEYEYASRYGSSIYQRSDNHKYWIYAMDLVVPTYIWNTYYQYSISWSSPKFVDLIKSIWNKEIRKKIKEDKQYFKDNWIKNIASYMRVPYDVLIQKMHYLYNC
jgi:hypothetical protein